MTAIPFAVLITAALAAIALSWGVVALVQRYLAPGLLIDVPNERSNHSQPTPRGGGLGIALVTLLGLSLAYFRVGGWPPLVFAAFCVGGVLMAGIGLWDDARRLSAKFRLGVQVLAGIMMVSAAWSGPDQPLLGSSWLLHTAVSILGVLWVVGLTNAYNFMDGIDGIAGLQGVVAGLAWALLGWYAEMPMVAAAGGLLAATSLGFVGHNWHPARIFMGDVGSMFLGFSFAALALIAGTANPALMLAGPLLLFPFVFDSMFTFLRRLIRGENVFHPHREHLYQRLVAAGLAHSEVAAFYGILTAVGAVIAFVILTSGVSYTFLLFVVPMVCASLLLTVAAATGSLQAIVASTQLSRDWLGKRLGRLERIHHANRVGTWAVQAAVFAVSGYAAFLLRFDFSLPEFYAPHAALAIPVWVVVKSVVFRLHRLDRGWWRFVSIHDLVLITAGNVAGSLCAMVLIVGVGVPGFPRSVFVVDFLLSWMATTGIRLAARIAVDMVMAARPAESLKRVLIYGAGRAGTMLSADIRSNSKLPFEVIGFIDDEPAKTGMALRGVRVLGPGSDLTKLVPLHRVEEVLIALPSATGEQKSAVIRACQLAGVKCRTIPALEEIIHNRDLTSQIRDLNVEELLNRSPVRLEEDKIRRKIQGQVVMVTGAAGSIGSELCRQIARYQPSALIGLDAAETPLFHLEREINQKFPHITFVPVVSSIQSPASLDLAFSVHRPSLVYHAAAYKHVPLMEAHPVEAVRNNVFGTYNLALAAMKHGATDFVMISSDKAVHPTSVMGATKRAAELVIRTLGNQTTKFVSVRFGNVLGSNGSVVPLFKEQIQAGGPVTVTDARMERFFMTIPEASQLVLQASTMGNGGEIFVLDMGTPVKIVDLARNLILLSGLRPDHDIKIEIVGARPGEKLREEISMLEEHTLPTRHQKIKTFEPPPAPVESIMRHLERLGELCQTQDAAGVVSCLKSLIPDYQACDLRSPEPDRSRSAAAAASSSTQVA